MKKIFLTLAVIMSLNLLTPKNTYTKVIIWDLGHTLFKTSKLQALNQIGLTDYIFYPFTTGKQPYVIPEIAFDILEKIKIKNANRYDLALATDKGKVLPLCFRAWLAGLTTGQDVIRESNKVIKELDKTNYFSTKREKRLVKNTIDFIFSPAKLASAQRPIGIAVNLLRECYKKEHKLIVLSNWAQDSFNALYNTPQGQQVFKYFKPENIIISGNINLVKPDNKAFEYVIKNYKVNPQDCIFIDDEPSNIIAAQNCGMTGLLIENGNFKKLKTQLKELKVI